MKLEDKKDYEAKENEYLEEIKGRDGIISKLIDERDDLQAKLDKDRIVKVLKKYDVKIYKEYGGGVFDYINHDQIANEICNE